MRYWLARARLNQPARPSGPNINLGVVTTTERQAVDMRFYLGSFIWI